MVEKTRKKEKKIMTYAEFFAEIKSKFMEADVSDISEHLAYSLILQERLPGFFTLK